MTRKDYFELISHKFSNLNIRSVRILTAIEAMLETKDDERNAIERRELPNETRYYLTNCLYNFKEIPGIGIFPAHIMDLVKDIIRTNLFDVGRKDIYRIHYCFGNKDMTQNGGIISKPIFVTPRACNLYHIDGDIRNNSVANLGYDYRYIPDPRANYSGLTYISIDNMLMIIGIIILKMNNIFTYFQICKVLNSFLHFTYIEDINHKTLDMNTIIFSNHPYYQFKVCYYTYFGPDEIYFWNFIETTQVWSNRLYIDDKVIDEDSNDKQEILSYKEILLKKNDDEISNLKTMNQLITKSLKEHDSNYATFVCKSLIFGKKNKNYSIILLTDSAKLQYDYYSIAYHEIQKIMDTGNYERAVEDMKKVITKDKPWMTYDIIEDSSNQLYLKCKDLWDESFYNTTISVDDISKFQISPVTLDYFRTFPSVTTCHNNIISCQSDTSDAAHYPYIANANSIYYDTATTVVGDSYKISDKTFLVPDKAIILDSVPTFNFNISKIKPRNKVGVIIKLQPDYIKKRNKKHSKLLVEDRITGKRRRLTNKEAQMLQHFKYYTCKKVMTLHGRQVITTYEPEPIPTRYNELNELLSKIGFYAGTVLEIHGKKEYLITNGVTQIELFKKDYKRPVLKVTFNIGGSLYFVIVKVLPQDNDTKNYYYAFIQSLTKLAGELIKYSTEYLSLQKAIAAKSPNYINDALNTMMIIKTVK